MKIIIPVAGAGNRLKPHTNTQPKPLLTVGGRSMLDHILEPLVNLNPDEVLFIIGHLGDKIRKHVTLNYKFKATFIEQDKLLGLGYAIHLALKQVDNSPLLIILGDTIADCDYEKFIGTGDNVLAVKTVSDDEARRLGIAEVKDNLVVDLEEKPAQPKSNTALIGLYYFTDTKSLRAHLEKSVKDDIRTSGEIQLTDALKSMISEGIKFNTYEVANWYDCGTKETLLDSNRQLLKINGLVDKFDGSVIVPPVAIDKTAKISNSVIGPNVSIAAECNITNVVLSDCIVNEKTNVSDTELSGTLLGPDDSVKGSLKKIDIGNSSELDI